MQVQVQYPIIPQQNLQFLDNQCKICYLELDEQQHYPMLICSAQHIICRSCFLQLTKFKRYIECPFCKRNTQVQNAHRFRYVLMVNAKYRQLKTKYFEMLSCLQKFNNYPQKDKYQLNTFFQQHKSVLITQQQVIDELKTRIKLSEDHNNSLKHQMEIEREKYTAFQREINQCKFNDLIMKNRITMVQYQLNKVLKEKEKIIKRYDLLKQDLYIQTKRLQGYIEKNQELIKENMALRQENYAKMVEAQISQNKIRKSRECPENDSPIIYQLKKSKSSSVLKEQTRQNSQDRKEKIKGKHYQKQVNKNQKKFSQQFLTCFLKKPLKMIKKKPKKEQ